MTAEAYPLQWPAGRSRTAAGYREAAKFDVTFARARDNIVREIELLAGEGSPRRPTLRRMRRISSMCRPLAITA